MKSEYYRDLIVSLEDVGLTDTSCLDLHCVEGQPAIAIITDGLTQYIYVQSTDLKSFQHVKTIDL